MLVLVERKEKVVHCLSFSVYSDRCLFLLQFYLAEKQAKHTHTLPLTLCTSLPSPFSHSGLLYRMATGANAMVANRLELWRRRKDFHRKRWFEGAQRADADDDGDKDDGEEGAEGPAKEVEMEEGPSNSASANTLLSRR